MKSTNDFDDLLTSAWHAIHRSVESRNTQEAEQDLQRIKRIEVLRNENDRIQAQLAELGLKPNAETTEPNHQKNGDPALDTKLDALFAHRRQRSKRPTRIRISGTAYSVSKLNEVPVAVGNWILAQGRELKELPRFVQRSSHGFFPSAQLRTLNNGWPIEIGDSRPKLFEKARRLLNACGFGAVSVEVMFEDGTTATL